jgi:predicted phosphodiesterase
MILAGDIVTLRDYEPLDQILRNWKKLVLYVSGNHEYYRQHFASAVRCAGFQTAGTCAPLGTTGAFVASALTISCDGSGTSPPLPASQV